MYCVALPPVTGVVSKGSQSRYTAQLSVSKSSILRILAAYAYLYIVEFPLSKSTEPSPLSRPYPTITLDPTCHDAFSLFGIGKYVAFVERSTLDFVCIE